MSRLHYTEAFIVDVEGYCGGLFARAARAGMMAPATHMGYELHEPSLGSSAKGAGVRVYRRAAA